MSLASIRDVHASILTMVSTTKPSNWHYCPSPVSWSFVSLSTCTWWRGDDPSVWWADWELFCRRFPVVPLSIIMWTVLCLLKASKYGDWWIWTQKADGGSGQCVSLTLSTNEHAISVDSSIIPSKMPATWCALAMYFRSCSGRWVPLLRKCS